MKPYQEVVEERYADGDLRERQSGHYALTHPLGALLVHRLRAAMVRAVRAMEGGGLDLSTARVLDIGCGWGLWTREWAELLGDASRVTGVDLSQSRLQAAARINPGINWKMGDACALGPELGEFDVASAIVVLMHLKTGEELDGAWRGMRSCVRAGGWLLIYERTGQDHDASHGQEDHAGFLDRQLIEPAARNGFTLVQSEVVFKELLGLGHSAWLPERKWPRMLIAALD